MLSCMGVLWTQQDDALVRHVILHLRPFSVVEMVSLLQVYATTGLNLLRKDVNTKGCRISFHNSTESQR